MRDFLGITPVFAARWLKPYTKTIEDKEGFSWIFKTQVYPPGMEALTEKPKQKTTTTNKRRNTTTTRDRTAEFFADKVKENKRQK